MAPAIGVARGRFMGSGAYIGLRLVLTQSDNTAVGSAR